MKQRTDSHSPCSEPRKTSPGKVKLPFSFCLGALLATATTMLAASQLTPVATGLNNPRGLAFGPNGKLYVAEAGLGAGDGHGGFGVGVGFTGSIAEIGRLHSAHPTVRQVVTGLASVGDTNNGFPEVVGPDGISLHGEGGMYVCMAESSAGVFKDNPGVDASDVAEFGQLLKLTPSGRWKSTADVGDFDYLWSGSHKGATWAPAGQFPDANPYSVLALPGHRYVVDAGANTLDEVRPNGSIRIIAYIPNPLFPNPNYGKPNGGPEFIPISDSVPTCVAQGPDGYLYVCTLAFGANFARFSPNSPPSWAALPKQSKVYRVNPKWSNVILSDKDVWADDLNPSTGCGFGPGGFYVTEYLTEESGYQTGDIVKIAMNPDGTAGTRTKLGVGVLHEPNGFACGPKGAIYVSNNSTSTGSGAVTGEVVRVNY